MKLMIDLETLGTSNKAHVLSLGVAFFDNEKVHRSAHMLISPEGQEERERSYSTVMWWLKQASENPEAAKGVTEGERLAVANALWSLSRMITEHQPTEVWANSPTFDCAILRDLYGQFALDTPWPFWAERDFRTLKSLTGGIVPAFEGVQHNAEADAVYQAKCVIHLLSGQRHMEKVFREVNPGMAEAR